MDGFATVLRGAALLGTVLLSGWLARPPTSRRADGFAIACWGVAVTSVVGVLLARAAVFSLGGLAIGCGLASIAAWAATRSFHGGPAPEAAPPRSRAVAMLAGASGLVAAGAAWPPFETVLAAADSTMYVNAGMHLARTGSLTVTDTVAGLLPPALATGFFPSVGIFGQGPFVRLAGGLLMRSLDAGSATPGFFPLLPVWTGALAAVGGPAAALLVAPLGIGFAVWALTLFAGETFGLVVAAVTALVCTADFAVWWFGRFPMSEPLTMAFVWSGFVFLGRGSPFAAGLLLGLGGLARAETLLFAAVAVVWWDLFTDARGRDVGALTAGLVVSGVVALAALLTGPSHHLSYLTNDLSLHSTYIFWRMRPAFADGRIATTVMLLPVLPLLAGLVASWRGGATRRQVIRAGVVLATIGGVALYYRIGGREDTLQHLGWLTTYLSLPGVVLAVIGSVIVWRRGGHPAQLALLLSLLVAALFVPNPRVGAYQPWAIRRYLPILLPAMTLAAAVALGVLLRSRRRPVQAVGAILLAVVVALEVAPIRAVHTLPYYAGSLEGVRRVAELTPSDALIVVDSGFADVQLQVPLWLAFGRETVMATGGRPAWRALLETLVATGRPVYWIQNRLAVAPSSEGLAFTPTSTDLDFLVELPDAPANTPPTQRVRKLIPVSLYGVGVG